MTAIEFDISRWPLVVATFPEAGVSDADLERYFGRLQGFFEAGLHHAIVTDASRVQEPITARQAALVQRWMEQHRSESAKYSVAHAIVLASARMKGVMAGVDQDVDKTRRVVASVSEGLTWCRAELRNKGVLHKTSDAPEALPIDLSALPSELATVAAVITAFDQPAWLVSADGSVLSDNYAARRLFARPPEWLSDVVTDSADTSVPDSRCLRLEHEGDSVYLIVPYEEAPRVQLPPSLERIARLLAQGLSDKEIAAAADLPMATVRTYVSRVFRRLGVHSRGELMRRWSNH